MERFSEIYFRNVVDNLCIISCTYSACGGWLTNWPPTCFCHTTTITKDRTTTVTTIHSSFYLFILIWTAQIIKVLPLLDNFVEEQIPYFICLAKYFTFYSKILQTYIEEQRHTAFTTIKIQHNNIAFPMNSAIRRAQ